MQKLARITPSAPAARRQLVIGFEQPQLWTMQATERRKIIVNLANLLMQAAGDAQEENSDDER
ncbi:MAG: hypothetical protein WA733_13800 [Methylocystis sp.]